MNVCVFGLWHLGSVTAACLAGAGHAVTGLDPDPAVVAGLSAGRPPLFEPGLEDLVRQGLAAGRLRFTADPAAALVGAEVLWVTFDTPVDNDDQADVAHVFEHVTALFPHLPAGALVLVSSQVPVGTTRRLEEAYQAAFPDRSIGFAYSPENLRLGSALRVFTQPDRVVVGVRRPADRERLAQLFAPITGRLEWMSVESAEMTKHALNAFLAASVAFANELAILGEQVGADAKEVERGLKSEARIGPRAYLSPGAAFAGGTLARDVAFLTALGAQHGLPTPLLAGVRASNDAHKHWPRRRLLSLLGSLARRRVAVWGLTYKPGTDTLRRSLAVEFCRWLLEQGAQVRIHDPTVKALPPELGGAAISPDPLAALAAAEALVVATEWPDYKAIPAESVVAAMARPLVLDPNRALAATLGADPRVAYYSVGQGVR
jgi:UDPglucose 6-dehydrogenase